MPSGINSFMKRWISVPFLRLVRRVEVGVAASQLQHASSNNNVYGESRPKKARRKDKDLPPPSNDEHKLYLEEAVLERKIPDTDLRQLVDHPSGLDYNEWLASHTLAFFEHINLIYGTISEFCTMSGCPDMVGPAQRQYQWYDEKGKKCKVAAPQYVDYVMTFTQKTINDECIFPSKFANEFPSSFESIVKKIHRLLFHVLAHLYYAHFKEIWMLGLHSHLNCIFANFILFNERFRLVDDKEIEILHDLVAALKLHSGQDDEYDHRDDAGQRLDEPRTASPAPMDDSDYGETATATGESCVLAPSSADNEQLRVDGDGATTASASSEVSSAAAASSLADSGFGGETSLSSAGVVATSLQADSDGSQCH